MPAISIVANFYNSEKYINKLIRSVRAQTFADWELVAVNDCSPGRDSEILHRWAKKDSRIRVIDNSENLGIARAKKAGIDAARGQYITFIDGDDWFEKEALEHLYSAAKSTGSDIVIMEYYRTYPLGIRRRVSLNLSAEDYGRRISHDEFIERFYYLWVGGLCEFYPYWGKLYRTSTLQSFGYEYVAKDEIYAEDVDFMCALLPTLDSLTFITYPGYNWRYGGISTMTKPYEFYKVDALISVYWNRRHASALKLIDLYNVEKARKRLQLEVHNTMYDFLMRLVYPLLNAHAEREAIIDAIEQHLLNTPLYNDISVLDAFPEDAMMGAIKEKNADSVLNLIKERYDREWKIRLARRLSPFLPYFS